MNHNNRSIMTMTMNATCTKANHEDRTSYECEIFISTITSSSSSSILAMNGSLPNKQLATLPFLQDTYHHDHNEPRELTLHTAKVIVSSVDIIEQALKESGRSYDPNLPMQWAMARHTASLEIEAREQAEKRRYMYDNFQKGIDRDISQQQHQETTACMQEEPGWMTQLKEARSCCLGSISTASSRGILLVALTKLVPFLYFVWSEGASFTEVAGTIIVTVSLDNDDVCRYVSRCHLANGMCCANI
jgi:hypothetical protein